MDERHQYLHQLRLYDSSRPLTMPLLQTPSEKDFTCDLIAALAKFDLCILPNKQKEFIQKQKENFDAVYCRIQSDTLNYPNEILLKKLNEILSKELKRKLVKPGTVVNAVELIKKNVDANYKKILE
ncbi:MAG TPA: hypothetical protein VJL60_04465, partial [Gammaproteobacteria bacterium]|nr:hypothetical protein [Gammaproteobacteria bacterium]